MNTENNPIEITLSDRLSSVGEYYFSKKLREVDELRKAGREIISLGVGSPDLPAAKVVCDRLAVESAKPGAHGYQSYIGSLELRSAFCYWYQTYYGVTLNPQNEVLPLIGSKEGVMHCMMTYLSKGDKVLVPNPGYPTYTSAVNLAGGVIVEYKLKEENDFQINFDEIEADGLKGVKIMVVNYPHMPTGTTPKEGLFENIVKFAKKHNILVLHDNPYSFIRNEKPMSLLSVEGAKDCVLELNSLSKSHNMAGWRLGALMGAKERITEVLRFKSNMDSGMFLPMQLAAAEALHLGDDWYESLNKVYKEREELGYAIIDKLGCTARKNQAGLFIWGKLPENSGDCYEFIDKILLEKGVFITPGAIFGSEGKDYIRISLCAPKEKLQEALNKL
ncbi:MAG: aminotransferase class I/II-fold pyridoxal phosphate-dependent enzyme [Rikenellaceae bacterium]